MENPAAIETEQILGIPFFHGTPAAAARRMSENGGLLVAPSGTCFERFLEDAEYRRALLSADLVLPDSGAMVALWRLLRGRTLRRISGLVYLQELLGEIDLRDVVWVLPHERARGKLLAWARGNAGSEIAKERRFPNRLGGLEAAAPCTHSEIAPVACYIAPIYQRAVEDLALLQLIAARQPRHVIIAIGAGAQEKLGWYLRENLPERPAIHCIGGALGFLTGDQRAIPRWADRVYLGWFLRFLSQPRAFLPRLWKARVLPMLIARHGAALPPLRLGEEIG